MAHPDVKSAPLKQWQRVKREIESQRIVFRGGRWHEEFLRELHKALAGRTERASGDARAH
jgi:hypothetical protein